MLLLLVADHASEALLYLHTRTHHKYREKTRTGKIQNGGGGGGVYEPRYKRLHQNIVSDCSSSLHDVEKVTELLQHLDYNSGRCSLPFVFATSIQHTRCKLRVCHFAWRCEGCGEKAMWYATPLAHKVPVCEGLEAFVVLLRTSPQLASSFCSSLSFASHQKSW
jgi:hypothetical protein